ncbi:MerR family transcriptional regulator [Chryseolinea lacunae]|uniref:MerR family transcriptional regulator n=1 Tax=Chryseolinea lacunae TaxID=2801331 RepID=A0ABS1KLZ1_9BACT|nr:MerR family transcriptional regulator [Chryseolinea lacunae]MBL0739702.1 MerR family transcriptional regulator [Chryseolinea lacunae]
MGKYSIKELEQLSGIKAHTIRIWEKRHNLIAPSRTATNIRYYSDEDLKKIINVSLLNNNGIKISKIADMTPDAMKEKVLQISSLNNDTGVHIDQLVVAMIDMEEELFEKILNNLILHYGFEKAITDVIYPFLEKIGILWQTHNITPAHEHFISNLIRQKIIVAIDGLPLPPKTSKKILLFLPEGEMHEMGLLFYHFLTRKGGYRTYYLGQNVPHEDLVSVYKAQTPDILLCSITSTPDLPIEEYLNRLVHDFPACPILVSGYQVQRYKGEKIANVQTFSTALELRQYI